MKAGKMSHKKKHEETTESNPFNKDMDLDNTAKAEENKETEQTEAKEVSKDNELQAKYDELNNKYIRLAADFENFRKRQAQEREDLLKYGAVNTLKQLIEVLDNFDRGQKAVENIEDCQKVKDSFNLVMKQMKDTLTKLGLEVIETEGKEFDPNFHEAVMQTPTSEHPEGTIINELQKGYKVGDKVLRASLVNVASAE
ncbi:MAG: nucleotide exchange factor GrpE [Candidatus Melainabacteria bacterium]|nr:MAG: nucleotide exchange factor GrpE [Candidatus Melainabacteria bacterium]RAI13561.1 MAG: nucleotide exchange factor GrpE [Candidatus Melainabacteria bacterium]